MHQNTSITKASALASSYGNARASPTVADANAPAGWAAEADRAASATAPATRAPSSPSRTTSYRTATSSSTARPREATAPAGDPDFDVYATGGLNAFVCTTTFLGFDQFSFWNSCMGSHADSQVVPDAKLAAGGSPLPGSPAIGSGKNPTSKCAGQPTPGPRRPGLQQRRHDPPRHRALEHRRELAPPVGGPRVRRAHDHDQRARAAAEHRRQERADAEERGQLRPRQHRRRQWHPEHQISGRSHDERKVARRTRRTRAPACMPSFGAASRSFAFPPGRVVPMRFATASAHGGAEQQRKDARRERSRNPRPRARHCQRVRYPTSTLARDRLAVARVAPRPGAFHRTSLCYGTRRRVHWTSATRDQRAMRTADRRADRRAHRVSITAVVQVDRTDDSTA